MNAYISNDKIEEIELQLIAHDHRGMSHVRKALVPGYLARAAELLHSQRGRVYIITGFPVAGSFETDGPAGAMAIYRLCEKMNLIPAILSDNTVTRCLSPAYRCHDLATGSREQVRNAVQDFYQREPPGLVISIERPGAAEDGLYYNMAGKDISAQCTPAEPYLELAPCPVIAIGDGGNELGMGKAIAALDALDIHPAVSTCDELIVADVSNWGAYALCALTYAQLGTIPDMASDIHNDLSFLVAAGAVDGVTGQQIATEDGFAEDAGSALTSHIIHLLQRDKSL